MPLVPEAEGRVFLREPVPGLLLEIEDGYVLLDTGFNGALVRDRAFYHRFWGRRTTKLELSGPGDPLEDAFAHVGVDPRDVVAVAVSHLHNDHVGGLRHFAGRAPVHLQRKELEAAVADPLAAERNAMFRIDFDDPRIEWRLADGDVEIAPGVTALLTAGPHARPSELSRRARPVGGGRRLRVRLRRGRPPGEPGPRGARLARRSAATRGRRSRPSAG